MKELFSIRDIFQSKKACPLCCRAPKRGKTFRLESNLKELGFPSKYAHPECVIAAKYKAIREKLTRGLK